MTEDELVTIVHIDRQTLSVWVESGWLRPERHAVTPVFSDVDAARARLIADLIGPLGVNAEGVGIILDLLDQVHGLRAAMTSLDRTLERQPDELRQRFRVELRRAAGRVREL